MIGKFWRDETGLEMTEYVVAASLVALAVVAAYQFLGNQVGTRITDLAGRI